jgi:hypothetical protein
LFRIFFSAGFLEDKKAINRSVEETVITLAMA